MIYTYNPELHAEYNALLKKLNRYKKKRLAYEYGCACGIITRIELVQEQWGAHGDIAEYIAVWGDMGTGEQVLMYIREDNISKGYKYDREFHIITDSARRDWL